MARGVSPVRLQRQRALARRRPNVASNEPDEPPSPDSVEVMGDIDRMPYKWRALVHYYGYVRVNALFDGGADPMTAWGQLETGRINRQQQWLDTDYIAKRTNRAKR